jgi:dihydroorotase (homodimeric type)
LMTLYLTDQTTAAEIRLAAATTGVHAVKLYPAGATTNSAAGVAQLEALFPTLAAMEEADLPLLIHGEVTDRDIDIFDREKVFIDRHLAPIVQRFGALRVVLEHITTADAVQFVCATGQNVAATITPHHLMFNRNDMLVGGIRPHYYCLPVLKRNTHQQALQAAAISGNPKFFLGSDSAVPGSTLLMPLWNFMRRCSNTCTHWTNWKISPRISGLTFIAWRATRTALHCARRAGTCHRSYHLVRTASRHCARGRRSAGG